MADRLRQILATAAAATLCYVILYASLSINTNLYSPFGVAEYHDALPVDEKRMRVPVRLAVRRLQVSIQAATENIELVYVEDDPVNDYLLEPNKHKRAVVRYNTMKRRVTLRNGQHLDALVPYSIQTFLRRWRRGRFPQCKPVLSRAANVSRVIPLSFVKTVAAFRDFCNVHKLVHIACNPVDALTATYGDRCFEDHPTSSYNWLTSARNVEFAEIYSSAEWPSVFREYNR